MTNRSFHFIPANKPKLIVRAASLEADHIIYDLEDGVPGGEKECARRLLEEHLSGRATPRTWVRCNKADTQDFREDMALLSRLPVVGIVIPKFEDIGLIDEIECNGLGKRQFIVIVESFPAVEILPQIAARKSIFGIALGLEDLFSEFAVPNYKLSELGRYVRTRALVAARANRRICIDGISTELHDGQQLENECEESRNFGFDGKFTIHPRQISVVNQFFSVSEESIVWARRILKKSGNIETVGYTMIDGELITPPKVAKAKSIIEATDDLND